MHARARGGSCLSSICYSFCYNSERRPCGLSVNKCCPKSSQVSHDTGHLEGPPPLVLRCGTVASHNTGWCSLVCAIVCVKLLHILNIPHDRKKRKSQGSGADVRVEEVVYSRPMSQPGANPTKPQRPCQEFWTLRMTKSH